AGHPLRDAVVEVRHAVRWSALARTGEARATDADSAVRDRTRRGGGHLERAVVVPRTGQRAAPNPRPRRGARAPPRLSASARDPGQVLLEERQVAARHRAELDRQAGLLGAVRLQQRRRPVERGALRVLGGAGGTTFVAGVRWTFRGKDAGRPDSGA